MASGLLFSRDATSAAISRSRRCGIGRLRRLRRGLGQLLADLDRLEGQRARLDGEGQLVVVAVDDAAAHRLVDVGDLELARRLGAQARPRGTCRLNSCARGDEQQHQDDGVAGPVPEHERRGARAGARRRPYGCGARGRTPLLPDGPPDGLAVILASAARCGPARFGVRAAGRGAGGPRSPAAHSSARRSRRRGRQRRGGVARRGAGTGAARAAGSRFEPGAAGS